MNAHRLSAFILGSLIFLSTASQVYGQDGQIQPKNSLYLELGGNALVYSINYDRVLTDDFSARIGIGFYSFEDDFGDSASLAGIPITAHYLLGNGNSRLELGGGILVVTGKADVGSVETKDGAVLGTGVFAYRFQKQEGGLFFKAGFTPVIHSGSFLPWFGISIGYTL